MNDGPVYGGSPRERGWWMRPGVHESSILLGTVASPLLAGFALTLAVSILKDGKVMGFPSLALVSFTLAAGLLLLSLQATIRMRAAYWSAGELDAFLNRARDPEAMSKAQQQRDKDALAWSRWRTTATNSHNLGLLAFLVGVAAALAPNGDSAYWGARLGSALLVALFAVSWTAFAVIPAAVGSGRG